MKKKRNFESIIIMLCSLILIFPWSVQADNTKMHIFLGGQKLVTIDDEEIYFNIDDHLGSPSIIIDKDANIIEENDYSDFGQLMYSSSTIYNDSKFLGKELDSETSLGYFQNRYYDVSIARFLSIDPLMINILNATEYNKDMAVLLSNPQELNSYAYAVNNPVAYMDTSGNASMSVMWRSFFSSISHLISSIFNKPNSVNQTQAAMSVVSQSNINVQKTVTWDAISNERIKQLDSRVQQPAINFINNTESELNTQLRITQSYRSIEEQNKLYNQSRTNPPTGSWVTNANGGQSYHNYGLAIDVVVMENGQAIWKPISQDIANIASKQGFEWGGNWSRSDYPHFQMTFGQSWQDLLESSKE